MIPDPLTEQPRNSRLVAQGIKDGQFCQLIHLHLFKAGLFWIFSNAHKEFKET